MYLSFLVFLCGASVMILEIVGARFFAPYVGTSLTVWTGIIGVMMTGLSIGYWLGGAAGDRWKSLDRLRVIVMGAGAWMLLLVPLRGSVLLTLSLSPAPGIAAVAGAFLLLFPPSVLLGMVSPYALRLAAEDLQHVGRASGRLSALSTAGSILGTFLAGFVLIPLLRISTILAVIGLALLVTAAFRPQWRWFASWLLFFQLAASVLWIDADGQARVNAAQMVLAERETPYASALVRRVPESGWGTGVLLLQIDRGFHSAIFEDRPDDLVFGYTKYYRLADAARPDQRRTLLIGGGAFTVARDVLRRHPQATIDVVEIDPGIVALARQYFGLKDDPRLSLYTEDARLFLNRGGPLGKETTLGAYDVVYGDAFRSLQTVPFQLTTREAAARVAALLNDRGIYVMNVISSLTGARSEFLRSEVHTLQSVFPSVLAFEVPHTGEERPDAGAYANIIVLASKQPLILEDLQKNAPEAIRPLLASLVTVETDGAQILEDEYAPVEMMVQR